MSGLKRWTFTRGDMGIALAPDVSIKPMRHGTEAGERLSQRDMSGGGEGGVNGVIYSCTIPRPGVGEPSSSLSKMVEGYSRWVRGRMGVI